MIHATLFDKSKKLISAIKYFLYPTTCLHCQTLIQGQGICKACLEQLEWLDSSLACQICGQPKRLRGGVRCPSCRKNPIYLQPFAACFPMYGPALALRGQFEESLKLLTALLVLKWKELPWPMPDCVVPMPYSRLDYFLLKHQPSFLLAKTFSKWIGCQFKPVIKTTMERNSINYRARGDVADQKVLLLIDIIRESQEVKKCRLALETLFPKTIYTLALFDGRECKSIS